MSFGDAPSSPMSSFMSTFMRTSLRVGSVVVGLAAVLGGVLYVKQDMLLYFPEIGGIPKRPQDNPRGYRSPSERGIPFEDCRIPCSDGVMIHAWLLLQKDSRNCPTILFFHGNAGNIGLRLPNALELYRHCSCNVLLVEYRGYGDSDNAKIDEAGLTLDGQAALHYMMNHDKVDPRQLLLFGRSLGGAVAFSLARYAQQNNLPIAGLMVENTFLSISRMVDHLMPFLTPIKPLVLRIGWDSSKFVHTLKLPILYLAGDKDDLVPHAHMQQLVGMSTASKHVQVHVIQGGTHNECWMQGGVAYWDAMRSFVINVTGNGATASSTDPLPFGRSLGTGMAAVTASGQTSSIPTMPNHFADIAREASSNKNRASASNSGKQKKI